MCGKRVVIQQQKIEKVKIFWLNDLFYFFKIFNVQKTI